MVAVCAMHRIPLGYFPLFESILKACPAAADLPEGHYCAIASYDDVLLMNHTYGEEARPAFDAALTLKISLCEFPGKPLDHACDTALFPDVLQTARFSPHAIYFEGCSRGPGSQAWDEQWQPLRCEPPAGGWPLAGYDVVNTWRNSVLMHYPVGNVRPFEAWVPELNHFVNRFGLLSPEVLEGNRLDAIMEAFGEPYYVVAIYASQLPA